MPAPRADGVFYGRQECLPHGMSGFDILLEDDACIAVNKPGGLLTQAPLGIDSLEFRIRRYLAERDGGEALMAGETRAPRYLGVPHRIDRPASGVILFAKTLKAAQKLSLQFERRFIAKTYWALVEGAVEPEEGTWTDHLKKVYGQPRSVVVEEGEPEGRRAVLRYRVAGPIGSMRLDSSTTESSRPAAGTYFS